MLLIALGNLRLQLVAFVDSLLYYTQVVVCFRGTEYTESINWADVRTNARLKPVVISAGDSPARTAGVSWFRAIFTIIHEPSVHSGFLAAWESVRLEVEDTVYCCTQHENDWKVTFVGHSLGGALATLAAASFSTKG